jgi:hypothetical protein
VIPCHIAVRSPELPGVGLGGVGCVLGIVSVPLGRRASASRGSGRRCVGPSVVWLGAAHV